MILGISFSMLWLSLVLWAAIVGKVMYGVRTREYPALFLHRQRRVVAIYSRRLVLIGSCLSCKWWHSWCYLGLKEGSIHRCLTCSISAMRRFAMASKQLRKPKGG